MPPGELADGKGRGIGGRVLLTFFFALFLIFGLGAISPVARSIGANLETHRWRQTEAVIVYSQVKEAPSSAEEPRFIVRYTYNADGNSRTSDQFERNSNAPETGEAYQLAGLFPVGATVPCWFDPEHPASAVLRRGSAVGVAAILGPLVFSAIGAMGIWATWFRRADKSDRVPRAISSGDPAERRNRRVLAVFFSIFLLAGIGMAYPMLFRPLQLTVASRSWERIPCEIVSSAVRTHDGDDGDTYSVYVVYSYAYENRTYKSNRYHFFTGSSSGRRGKAEIVDRLPPGTQTWCYVNPHDPTEAVLEREPTAALWFGLFPLVFVAVGFFGLRYALRGEGRAESNSANVFTQGDVEAQAVRGAGGGSAQVILSPDASPRMKLIGIVIAAVFWNGIVSVFLFTNEWRGAGIMVGLFLLPFVAVGLFLVWSVFYQIMALFNPRVTLVASRGGASAGDWVDVGWEACGRSARIQRLQIHLEGREEATYRRGTDTTTDKDVFARVHVIDTNDPIEIRSGRARLQIPANAMHSFRSANNRVVWALKVHGDIPRWPDVNEEFPYRVLPEQISP